MEADAAYFSRRASEERAAAVNAEHPNAQQAHLEMAERYADLASAIESRDGRLGLASLAPGELPKRTAGQES